jgi:hypothetical protein
MVNLTNIRFTKEEMNLLNHGLQHSIEKPLKTYWTNLIAETERAMKLLDTELQNSYRSMAAIKLKLIYNLDNHHNTTQKRQMYILRNINHKLVTESAIIVRADKGKALVIINSNEYSKKVHTFLTDNNFHSLQKNSTDKYQKLIQKTLQQCNLVIDKKQIKYLIQKKPLPPTMKAQLKLHKPKSPIRPVINNMNAPSYIIAKHLINILNKHLTLNNHYNVKNSTNLATDLTKLKLNENHKVITYDIKDLYVNIPIEETLTVTKSMLLKKNDAQTTLQIITLLDLILAQNYFSFQNKIYQPNKGVSMGSPISIVVAKIFLQHLEDAHIKQLLDTKNIIFCTRYIDDILIIHDTK